MASGEHYTSQAVDSVDKPDDLELGRVFSKAAALKPLENAVPPYLQEHTLMWLLKLAQFSHRGWTMILLE